MARRYRPRKLFKFWLYHDLAEDVHLMDYIQFLVKTRQFATNVRNGLRLMWSLGQGDLTVLFELFPTLRSQFAPDNSALLEEFRQMLQQTRTEQPESTPISSGPKPLAAPRKLALPLPDDDDDLGTLVIKKSETAATDASSNFFNQIASYVQPAGHP